MQRTHKWFRWAQVHNFAQIWFAECCLISSLFHVYCAPHWAIPIPNKAGMVSPPRRNPQHLPGRLCQSLLSLPFRPAKLCQFHMKPPTAAPICQEGTWDPQSPTENLVKGCSKPKTLVNIQKALCKKIATVIVGIQ